jgi:hypothetical protein
MEARCRLKEACNNRKLTKANRNKVNYTKYMDGMQQALNEDVQENVMPYWRDHNSLKGKNQPIFNDSLCNYRLVLHELP